MVVKSKGISPKVPLIHVSELHSIYIYIYIPRTRMTHILEELTHKMEGQPPKKRSVGF